uniref:Zinc knuckle CX2CX4HX4C domain-containing protein n=1 Tax=Chenopodium quinoa TaxID=63459 RepID=A0A803LLX8_CHEQI
MGDVIEIEEDVLGIGRYRRVKLMLDTSKPLRWFQMIKDHKGRELRVDFAYERLPFFCFACGIMGHSEKDFHNVAEEDRQDQLGWSTDLKATPRKERVDREKEGNLGSLDLVQTISAKVNVIAEPTTKDMALHATEDTQTFVFGTPSLNMIECDASNKTQALINISNLEAAESNKGVKERDRKWKRVARAQQEGKAEYAASLLSKRSLSERSDVLDDGACGEKKSRQHDVVASITRDLPSRSKEEEAYGLGCSQCRHNRRLPGSDPGQTGVGFRTRVPSSPVTPPPKTDAAWELMYETVGLLVAPLNERA